MALVSRLKNLPSAGQPPQQGAPTPQQADAAGQTVRSFIQRAGTALTPTGGGMGSITASRGKGNGMPPPSNTQLPDVSGLGNMVTSGYKEAIETGGPKLKELKDRANAGKIASEMGASVGEAYDKAQGYSQEALQKALEGATAGQSLASRRANEMAANMGASALGGQQQAGMAQAALSGQQLANQAYGDYATRASGIETQRAGTEAEIQGLSQRLAMAKDESERAAIMNEWNSRLNALGSAGTYGLGVTGAGLNQEAALMNRDIALAGLTAGTIDPSRAEALQEADKYYTGPLGMSTKNWDNPSKWRLW